MLGEKFENQDRKGQKLFFEKVGDEEIFFSRKKRAKDFYRQNSPKTRPRYPGKV